MKKLILVASLVCGQSAFSAVYECKTVNNSYKEFSSLIIKNDSTILVNGKEVESGCNDIDNVLYCTFSYKSKFMYELAMDKNGQYGFVDHPLKKLANIDCDMLEQ